MIIPSLYHDNAISSLVCKSYKDLVRFSVTKCIFRLKISIFRCKCQFCNQIEIILHQRRPLCGGIVPTPRWGVERRKTFPSSPDICSPMLWAVILSLSWRLDLSSWSFFSLSSIGGVWKYQPINRTRTVGADSVSVPLRRTIFGSTSILISGPDLGA